MKPLIALNCEIDTKGTGKVRVNRTYVEAIRLSGGIPLPIAPQATREVKQLLNLASGFVFIGGNDYSPSRYGEEQHPSVTLCHPIREEFDFRLMRLALESRDKDGQPKPILCICAGLQLLNIKLGGSLHQDIETLKPGHGLLHRNREDVARHPINLTAGSQLRKIQRSATVKRPISSHHQCINRLGDNLVVTGRSDDGIIEAVEHLTREFTIGVQWHPEADYEGSARLFRALIRRARQISLPKVR
ncbi:MAG: gamma-glutamyl-gamma-aminobutyrate hydrolase family protein [Candidatus Melainabacteria bacterium]|nr:gamma-glutamyl-gamma-aminobutyrate hydrolase family protein [Candidatus Melainabacteria bacterium]